jgi:hypothetical protein
VRRAVDQGEWVARLRSLEVVRLPISLAEAGDILEWDIWKVMT